MISYISEIMHSTTLTVKFLCYRKGERHTQVFKIDEQSIQSFISEWRCLYKHKKAKKCYVRYERQGGSGGGVGMMMF